MHRDSASLRLIAETMEDRILHSADLAPLLLGSAAIDSRPADAATAAAAQVNRSEIAFVDAALPNAVELRADLLAQNAAGRPMEVVTIGRGEDGLALMTQTLAGRHDLSAVHVLSHGSDGRLQLGSSALDGKVLLGRAAEVAAWSEALTPDADLLLYGCDFAETVIGQRLVQDLAALTGADVAASTDLTGNEQFGGNWRLEYQNGQIEARVVADERTQAQWQGLMAIGPQNAVPGAQTALTNSNLVFSTGNGNAISISDADSAGGSPQITLTVTNGNATLSRTTGLTFIAGGNGTPTMTFRGTYANINAALNGLSYSPSANFTGGATLTISTLDENLVALNIDGALKGRYTFDDTSDLGNDTSPAGAYDGSCVGGATAAVDAARGNVLNLDAAGGADYVRMTGHFGSPSSVTLAAWVNFTAAPTDGGDVISLGDSTALRVDDLGNLKGYIYNGSAWKNVTYATTLAGTGWHHVAYTFDNAGNVQKLYLDGVQVAALAETGSISYTLGANSYIGTHGNSSTTHDYTGKIDDARVYSRALTAAEIANLASDLNLVDTDSAAITVNAVNDAPLVTTTSSTLAYTENAPATAIDPTLTVGDVDSANLASATVGISANYAAGQDLLSFVNQNGISGSWNVGTGVLTLTGSASVANYQTALRSVTYFNTSHPPNTATRTVSFAVNDGASNSNTTTRNVSVAALVNTQITAAQDTYVTKNSTNNYGASTSLVLDRSGGSLGDKRVLLQFDLSSIPAGATITSATLQMQATQNGSAFDINVYRLTEAWVEGNGNGSADAANWNNRLPGTAWTAGPGGTFDPAVVATLNTAAIGQHSWDLTSLVRAWHLGSTANHGIILGSPNSGTTTVTYDSSEGATPPRLAIAYTPAPNVAPIVTTTGSTLAYIENAAATAIDPALTVADTDSANLAVATVTISTNYAAGQDVLAFVNQNGISGSWNAGTGVLTLTGGATVANYQTALRSVTYVNTSEAPSTATRTVAFVVNDGAANSNTGTRAISVAAVNDAPLLTTSGSALAHTENVPATAIDPALTVNDVDNANVASATVSISANYAAGQDVLAFTNQNGISGNWNVGTGVLTLSGSASVANYQTALRSITYVNTSEAPSTATRTVSFLVNDGAANSNSATRSISMAALNDAPVLTGANNLNPINEDPASNPGTLVSALMSGQVSDVDSGALTGIAVTVVDNSNGNWQYTTDGGSSWTAFDTPTAGSARLLAADAMTSVRFVPNANWNGTLVGGLTFRAWDRTFGSAGGTADAGTNGGSTAFSSAAASAGITVASVNDAPSGADNTIVIDEDTARTFIAADFGFSDPNDSPPNTLNGVRISTLPGAGALMLSGAAVSAGQMITVANINAGLLVFTPAPNASGSGYASFTFQVRDNGGTANGGINLNPTPNTMTVNVSAVNDAPIISAPAAQATAFNTALVLSTANGNPISVADVDAGGADLEVTLNATNGTLILAGVAGLNFSAGGNGSSSMSFTGSLASINAALDGMIFAPSSNFSGAASVSVLANDQGNSGAGGPRGAGRSLAITVQASTSLVITDDTRATAEDTVLNAASVLANDSDPAAGTLTVSAVNGNSAAIGSTVVLASGATLAMNADGTFVYNPNGAFAALAMGSSALDSFSYDVSSTSGSSGSATVWITVNGANDAPALAGANALNDITEDVTGDNGTLVAALIAGRVSDADSGALAGVAITAADNANGTWQYTIDGGTSWVAFGTPTVADARLLAVDALTSVRFVPNPNWNGTVASGLTLRAWDRTSGSTGGTADTTGSGGSTAFSVDEFGTGITVTPVSDAPSGANRVIGIDEDTAHVFGAADFGFSDSIDSPADALAWVHIDTLPAAGALTNNGVPLSAGQAIAVADIIAGKLVFTPGADGSGAAYASFTFRVQDDGGTANGGADSDPIARTVMSNVNGVNDAPVLTTSGGTLAYTENDAATVIDSALTVNDVDNGNLSSATVTISTNYAAGQDLLAFVNQNGISGSWNAGGGVLTLTGNASVANYQTALRSITYVNTSEALSTATRTVSFVVNDSAANSNTAARSISMAALNDAPVLSASGGTLAYTENDAATAIDPALTVGDVDNANLTSATVSISANYAAGQDLLSFTNQNGISGSWNAGTGVLTLTGSATVANYETALRSITYVNTSEAPSTALRSVSFVVNDGTADSTIGTRSISVAAVNDAPTATNLNAAETYVEDTPLNLTDIVVSDLDSANVSVSLTVSDVAAGSLNTGTAGAVSSTYNAGTGVWSAGGAIGDVNALLAGLSFTPAANYNSSFSIATSVSDGVAAPLTGTKNMTGTAVSDAPTATNLNAPETYVENTPLNLTDIVVSDLDSANVSVTLTLSDVAAGSLNTGTAGAVSSTYVAGTGVWSASGAIADVNALLAGLTFAPAGNYNSSFSISISVSDGVAAPLTGTKNMTGTAVNDAPKIASPIADQTAIEDRTFSFTVPAGSFTDIGAGDTLSYSATLTSGGGLPAWLSFDAGTRTFNGTPANGDVGTLSIRVTATDGGGLTASDDFTLTVANVNDAPVLTSPVSNQSATQDSAFLFALPPGIFTDIDAGDTLSYSASLLSGAALPSWLSFNAASQTFSGTPSYADVGTHTLFVTATDSAGAAAHVLVAITVSAPAPAAPAPAVPAAPFVIPSQAPIVAPAESPPPAAEPRATNETQAAAAPVAPVSVPHAATVELLADDGYQPTSAEPSHRSDADVLVAMRLSSRADSVLADVELSQLTSPEPASFAQMLTSEDMRRRFEEMRHQLDEAADTRRNIIASGAALSGGLSIGYVIWLVRGGVLASAMLSALPAWQMIDPLPVLAATRKRGKRESDEPEVERLFDKASRPVRAGEAGAAGTISAKRIADHRVATAPTDPGQPEDAKR